MDEQFFRELEHRAHNTPVYPDWRFPPAPYYRFLRLLAEALEPNLSVELGVCGGGASLHLALGWPKGTVVGVECAVGSAWDTENWRKIGELCPNWVLWPGDSAASAPGIAKQHGAAGLLFIDTDHTYERTRAEWDAWEPFLAERCVVCLDDLLLPEMERFWDELEWSKVRLDSLHTGAEVGGGFGAAWKG